MNALNTAIYNKLNTASLTSLLNANNTPTSVYHLQAPDDARFAYVVFNKQSDVEDNITAHRIINTVYQVRGFTKTSPAAADAIALAIDNLLHNATLSITGFAQLRLVRIGGLEFVDVPQDIDKVYSAGSLFRLIVEKTA